MVWDARNELNVVLGKKFLHVVGVVAPVEKIGVKQMALRVAYSGSLFSRPKRCDLQLRCDLAGLQLVGGRGLVRIISLLRRRVSDALEFGPALGIGAFVGSFSLLPATSLLSRFMSTHVLIGEHSFHTWLMRSRGASLAIMDKLNFRLRLPHFFSEIVSNAHSFPMHALSASSNDKDMCQR